MTDKMKFETKDLIQENIAKIGQLFPEVLTEAKDDNGILKKAIDFDKLRQILSDKAIDNRETYDFTWVGKKQAILEAATPIRKTLRPCKEESVNWDTTQNLYIEGDNLDVLKLLQDCYPSQVKMIYIDPPYNTGNDFIYRDDFAVSQKEYNESEGRVDECGNRLVKNTDSNGRFHSDWCSMMYPRLKLARNLLADDGVIFISIDDNEVDNLRKICDEVFGEENFIATCTRVSKRTSNKGTFFKPTKDYVLVYAKNIANINWKFGVSNDIDIKEYKYEDEHGKYKKNGASLYQPSLDSRPNQRYYIECPDGSLIIPPGTVFPTELKDGASVKPLSNQDKCWRWSKESYLKKKHLLIFTSASSTCPLIDSQGNPSKWNIYDKVYLDKKIDETLLPEDIIYDFVNSQGTKELLNMNIPFQFAKPSGLIDYLIRICHYEKNILVLDFFSGSATTAHAVMKLNAEDGGNRKFIMVQLPEPCDEKSEAYKAGYKNICEIGKERIRRAAKQIKGEHPESNFDGGFRVFKLAESNMKEVYFSPSEYKQDLLSQMTSNIKEDRTDMDLLYGCMLERGLPLSYPHTSEKVGSYTIHNVNNGALMACFDENIPEDIIRHMAAKKPRGVVFRDAGFADSPAKINVGELFKLLSPDTKVKVI